MLSCVELTINRDFYRLLTRVPLHILYTFHYVIVISEGLKTMWQEQVLVFLTD